MIEIVSKDININWISKIKLFLIVSVAVMVICLLSIFFRGLNMGLDFTGGILLQIRADTPISLANFRRALQGKYTFNIQNFEGENEFIIRSSISGEELKKVKGYIMNKLRDRFKDINFEIRREETVGPRVGKDLRRKGLLSVIAAIIMMLVYITFRFEFRFGLGAILALIHDVIIAVGFLSIFHREVNLTTVAALLTVVGYSINDTIVVCDRIRENRRKSKRTPEEEIINRSINETLSRTILTSLTTLLVVFTLLILGGEIIRNFAFVLAVGFISGTYSSIAIASPTVLYLAPAKKKKR